MLGSLHWEFTAASAKPRRRKKTSETVAQKIFDELPVP
jgi:hypothetical protein